MLELPDELLVFLDSAVNSRNPEAVQRYLAENPQYSKNALIYLQNAQQMQNHFSVNSQDVFDSDAQNTDKRSPQTTLQKFSSLFNFRWPVWINVPIAAAAVVVLSVTALIPDKETIISYQDSPFLEISLAQRPGMGFFTNAEKEKIKFDNVVVKLRSDGDVELSWPEIDKATIYNVNVTVMKDNTKQQIFHVATNDNHVVIKKGLLVNNRRIEWQLAGAMSDGRHFSASGGFVLQQ